MYLLDTNILIYFLHGNEKVANILSLLLQEVFFISSMTRFEAEVGIEKEDVDHDIWLDGLDEFIQIPFDAKIVKIAVPLFISLGSKRHMFKDAIIAATAIAHDMTLITADKDFTRIPGLKYSLVGLE